MRILFFIQLPFRPNSYETAQATATSADGTYIAGRDGTTVNPFGELVRWSDPEPGGATAQGLGFPAWGAHGMWPTAISNDGNVIAGHALDSQGTPTVARWADPTSGGPGFTTLGDIPDGPYSLHISFVYGMTGDGTVIVGASGSVDQQNGESFGLPFRWELTNPNTGEGEVLVLPLLKGFNERGANAVTADGSVIAGECWSDDNTLAYAVYWIDGKVIPLGSLEPDGTSRANAISPDGTFIVGMASLGGTTVPYRWTADGGMQPLDTGPKDSWWSVRSVANDGTAIGSGSFPVIGVVWKPDGEIHDLSDWLLTEYSLDTSRWAKLVPADISADGRTIVGRGDLGIPATAPWLAYLGEVCIDLDGDGNVGVKDLLFLLGAWGDCPAKGDCLADFDNSGDVGVKDLLFLLGAWGPCP